MRHLIWFLLVLVSCAGKRETNRLPLQPNILFIAVDDLRPARNRFLSYLTRLQEHLLERLCHPGEYFPGYS